MRPGHSPASHCCSPARVSPNLLGEVFVVAQAIATGVFAELQYVGLRREERRGWAGLEPDHKTETGTRACGDASPAAIHRPALQTPLP